MEHSNHRGGSIHWDLVFKIFQAYLLKRVLLVVCFDEHPSALECCCSSNVDACVLCVTCICFIILSLRLYLANLSSKEDVITMLHELFRDATRHDYPQ